MERKMTSVEDLARQNCASLLRASEERQAAARAAARALASAASRLSLAKRQYKCEICNLTFNVPQALGGHMAHHARTHECKECHARFTSVLAVKNHRREKIRECRRRRLSGSKSQSATHQDKPVLPFDLNLSAPED